MYIISLQGLACMHSWGSTMHKLTGICIPAPPVLFNLNKQCASIRLLIMSNLYKPSCLPSNAVQASATLH